MTAPTETTATVIAATNKVGLIDGKEMPVAGVDDD